MPEVKEIKRKRRRMGEIVIKGTRKKRRRVRKVRKGDGTG